jgi:Zn-dependent protease
MQSVRTIWDGLNWSVLRDIFLSVLPALLCITFHELCHGVVAYKLGDPTARNAGRLTLNPLRHIDVVGLIMMVIFKFGWAKPVPVNMAYFRNPRRDMAVTALAGPLSNLLFACATLFIYGVLAALLGRLGGAGVYVLQMVYLTAYLSLAFAVFNLIPIPPLDGSKALFAFLPDKAYAQLMRYERYGVAVLLLLVSTGILGSPLSKAIRAAFQGLFFFAEWGYRLLTAVA